MSRMTTRHLVATYVTTANISGVGRVYASPPKISRTSDMLANVPDGTPSGSVIYVEILQSAELRIGVGGPVAGKKMITHDLRLHVLFRSRQARAEDAMDDHDVIIEALLELLRADRTIGAALAVPFPIFQNGEGTAGITVQTGMPKDIGSGTTQVWSLIDTQATEIITA
jgi:hypothetical protein